MSDIANTKQLLCKKTDQRIVVPFFSLCIYVRREKKKKRETVSKSSTTDSTQRIESLLDPTHVE
jgi:hypothetical protein